MAQSGCRRKHELFLNRLSNNGSLNKMAKREIRGTDNGSPLTQTARLTTILVNTSPRFQQSCHCKNKLCISTLAEKDDLNSNKSQDNFSTRQLMIKNFH